MRKVLLTVAAVVAMSAGAAAPAAAYDYPFCKRGEGGGGDCRYDTLAQCLAAVSGTSSDCQPNYWLQQRSRQAAPRGRARGS